MNTEPQWETIQYNPHFIYLTIYDHTECQSLDNHKVILQQMIKSKMFPLVVSFESNSELDTNEGLYSFQNETGYLRLPEIDVNIETEMDKHIVLSRLQFMYQIGKQKGHEVLFVAFSPNLTCDAYWSLFKSLLRQNNGVFKNIYMYSNL